MPFADIDPTPEVVTLLMRVIEILNEQEKFSIGRGLEKMDDQMAEDEEFQRAMREGRLDDLKIGPGTRLTVAETKGEVCAVRRIRRIFEARLAELTGPPRNILC